MATHAGNMTAIFGPGGFNALDYAPPAEVMYGNPEAEFLEVLRAAGYQVESVQLTTERVGRCADPADKPGGDAGWYWLRRLGQRAIGGFGSWRDDSYTEWVQGAVNGDNRLTHEERTELDAARAAERQAREARAAESHEAAAVHAAERLSACGPASAEHPYLVAKGVQPHGLYQLDQTLLIPRYTLDGCLWSFQTITAEGTKRYQAGGKAGGTCHVIGALDGAACIAIAEGYATGASVHQATGWPVLVAFDAGNLTAVAEAARDLYPQVELVVCGDDDHQKPDNPGRNAAARAAQASGARVALPQGLRPGESDWNDLGQREGLGVVREQLEADGIAATDAAQLMGKPLTPLDWVVEPWLLRGYVHLFAADGGTGKTTLAQQWGICIATGQPWYGLPVAPGPVLMVLCEDDEAAIARRQKLAMDYLQVLSPSQLIHRLVLMPRLNEDSYLAHRDPRTHLWTLTSFFHALDRRMRLLAPVVLFIDSLSDIFSGSEIDRAEVSGFITHTLARLAHEHNCAVVVLAHTPKAGPNGQAATYAGSTAWNNKVRVRLALSADPDMRQRLWLSIEKSNYGPVGERLELRQFGGVVMRPDEVPNLLGDDALDPAEVCADTFVELLREGLAADQNLSTQPAANNYAPRHFLHAQRKLGFTFTKSQFEDAMHDLLRRNIVCVVPYRGSDRKRLEIASTARPWSRDEASDS